MLRILRLLLSLLLLPTAVGAEEGAFVSGRVKIRYLVKGQGEPVVLIHRTQLAGQDPRALSAVLRQAEGSSPCSPRGRKSLDLVRDRGSSPSARVSGQQWGGYWRPASLFASSRARH